MAIIKIGGSKPNAGKVLTTMGYREPRPPLCMKCGQRKPGGLYTVNGNGQTVCPDCAGEKHRVVLTGCEDVECACGKACDDGQPA